MKYALVLGLAFAASFAQANNADGLSGYQMSQNEMKNSYKWLEATTTSCSKIQRRLSVYGFVYLTVNGQPKSINAPYVRDARECVGFQKAMLAVVPSADGACAAGFRCVMTGK